MWWRTACEASGGPGVWRGRRDVRQQVGPLGEAFAGGGLVGRGAGRVEAIGVSEQGGDFAAVHRLVLLGEQVGVPIRGLGGATGAGSTGAVQGDHVGPGARGRGGGRRSAGGGGRGSPVHARRK